jgi:hypothetical protein
VFRTPLPPSPDPKTGLHGQENEHQRSSKEGPERYVIKRFMALHKSPRKFATLKTRMAASVGFSRWFGKNNPR